MNDSPDTRQLLLAYLLKELSADDRRAFDERVLVEQEFSDQMREAEYDLIDDYHAGRLTGAERSRAEAAFSPQRLAQTLAPALSPDFVHPSSNIEQRRNRGLSPFRWSLAALALAICIAGGWFLFFYQRIQPEMAQKVVPTTSTDKPSMFHPPEGETAAVLLLASGVTRGPGGPTLELHPFTRVIEVEWVAPAVPADSSAQSFELSVIASDKILCKVNQDGPLKNVDGKRVATFHLAPSVFTVNSADSHFLFMIAPDTAHSISAEFAVSVSRR